MLADSTIARVARKELGRFFLSPVAWLFLGTFSIAILFVFFWVESFFARNVADVRPLFEWMPVLFIFLCAALTMRQWSEERSAGTLEHVLTQAVSPWHFVLGKFIACITLLAIALASTIVLPVTVSLVANLDWGPVVAGYIAAICLGAMYIAIGLFVSSRTDNPVVSLILTVALCGALYLLGSNLLTGLLGDASTHWLRQLGSGARFESITRGVIDARDLFYYLSIALAFLALNTYSLEALRWSRGNGSTRARNCRSFTALLLANLLIANLWLHRVDLPRVDMTEGQIYSLSQTTRDFLQELEEPLLVRGYFSDRTHPRLAPLVPQVKDLLREYATASDGLIKVEFVDPATNPAMEQEANERYGIRSTPFSVADRHESSLVNAYFNVLVQYGTEHRTLSFADLVELRQLPNEPAEIRLRNPEYGITLAIRKALYDYHAGGNLFEGIEEPVELIGYISGDTRLPDDVLAYKRSIAAQLEVAQKHSNGKLLSRFLEPEVRGGAVAKQIQAQWGFKPITLSEDQPEPFYFYMVLADSNQVVQLPTNRFDPTEFRLTLDSGLKRFTADFTKVVALSIPDADPQLAKFNLDGAGFKNLERVINRDYSIRLEDLSDGSVTPDADILVVVAPDGLEDAAVFAVDQFLMRGGTVILSTAPYSAELRDNKLTRMNTHSGLQDWLGHHGIEIAETLVLDEQHTSFSAPVTRVSDDFEFQEMQVVDYPYFVDVRPPGLVSHPVTSNLPQVTLTWASPVVVGAADERHTTTLLASSDRAWRSDNKTVMPKVGAQGAPVFARSDTTVTGEEALGVLVEGRFDSYFANSKRGGPSRSPESARIILFASNDFMSDRVLSSIVAASGTRYLGPLELLMNTLDWALEDEQLLGIRARGHFNRTLPPMDRQVQLSLEYANYILAVALLLLFALVTWFRRRAFYSQLVRGLPG